MSKFDFILVCSHDRALDGVVVSDTLSMSHVLVSAHNGISVPFAVVIFISVLRRVVISKVSHLSLNI